MRPVVVVNTPLDGIGTRWRSDCNVHKYNACTLVLYSGPASLFFFVSVSIVLHASYGSAFETDKPIYQFLLCNLPIVIVMVAAFAMLTRKLAHARAYKLLQEFKQNPIRAARDDDHVDWLDVCGDSERFRYIHYADFYPGSQSANTFFFTALFLSLTFATISTSLDNSLKLHTLTGFVHGTNLFVSTVIIAIPMIITLATIAACTARAVTSKYYGNNHMFVKLYKAYQREDVENKYGSRAQRSFDAFYKNPKIKNIHHGKAVHIISAVTVFLQLAAIVSFSALHDVILNNHKIRIISSAVFIIVSSTTLMLTTDRFFSRIQQKNRFVPRNDLKHSVAIINGETIAMCISSNTLLLIGVSTLISEKILNQFMSVSTQNMHIGDARITNGQITLATISIAVALAIILPTVIMLAKKACSGSAKITHNTERSSHDQIARKALQKQATKESQYPHNVLTEEEGNEPYTTLILHKDMQLQDYGSTLNTQSHLNFPGRCKECKLNTYQSPSVCSKPPSLLKSIGKFN